MRIGGERLSVVPAEIFQKFVIERKMRRAGNFRTELGLLGSSPSRFIGDGEKVDLSLVLTRSLLGTEQRVGSDQYSIDPVIWENRWEERLLRDENLGQKQIVTIFNWDRIVKDAVSLSGFCQEVMGVEELAGFKPPGKLPPKQAIVDSFLILKKIISASSQLIIWTTQVPKQPSLEGLLSFVKVKNMIEEDKDPFLLLNLHGFSIAVRDRWSDQTWQLRRLICGLYGLRQPAMVYYVGSSSSRMDRQALKGNIPADIREKLVFFDAVC